MSTAYSTNAFMNMTPPPHDANRFALPDSLRRRALRIRTGHHGQPDRSAVRVDTEMGRCIVRRGRWRHTCSQPEGRVES
jgi:hypothetical protein